MKSVFDRFFRKQGQHKDDPNDAYQMAASTSEDEDVKTSGFPLVPDDYHLQHVGKTVQGNGYWIDNQLTVENGDTRDFVAAYVFDSEGNLISLEVIDRGLRSEEPAYTFDEIIEKLKKKIDAKCVTEITVKPFAVSFYGHTFGLVVREGEEASEETLIDAMPGHTLMFYGPWSLCNYDT